MSWRNCLIKHLHNNGLQDVYQFGVYSGQSMIDIANAYFLAGVRFDTLWGFDSFEGLPDEKAESVAQECWVKGEFSSQELFNATSVQDALSRVQNKITGSIPPYGKMELIPGFFENSLTADAVKVYGLKSASYIDIDVDLYSSAKECLTFLFKHNLVKSGTLIGYDDWGGSHGWKTMSDGESRAHREIAEEFGVKFQLLEQFGGEYPHCQVLFKVI